MPLFSSTPLGEKAEDEVRYARCEEEHHAKDHEHSDHAPGHLHNLPGAAVKKKAHRSYQYNATIQKWQSASGMQP